MDRENVFNNPQSECYYILLQYSIINLLFMNVLCWLIKKSMACAHFLRQLS